MVGVRYDRFLAASEALQSEVVPPQHSQKTPHCPDLPRFGVGRVQGWPAGEAAHVSTCPFCRKVEAMFQRAEQADKELPPNDTLTDTASENTQGQPATVSLAPGNHLAS